MPPDASGKTNLRGARVLVFAPSHLGGLAEHVHYQASELARRGFEVTVLCCPDFFKPAKAAAYRQQRRLFAVRGRSVPARIGQVLLGNILNHYLLAWHIVRRRPRFVLMEANTEFYALAWALPHWLLRLLGTTYVANFHDPVRKPGLGPRWLHALTLRAAYSPLAGGLLHGPVPPAAYLPARLVVREAPFGPFEDLAGTAAPFDLRERLGIDRKAFVLLAFGHIADRKNLDLVIEAVGRVGGVHLVVAGEAPPGGDKPIAHYAEIARRNGAAERVHFAVGFIPEAEIAAYFAAADAVALTYERAFVSQSGVLQIAALWDRPLLASGGEGPLRRTVTSFGLGEAIEPDSAAAIEAGLKRLVAERPDLSANFARYRAGTSWAVNVDRLLEVVEAARAGRAMRRPGSCA